MAARCFGEFMGTLVLVLLGDGVVANVLLKRQKAEGGTGWMVLGDSEQPASGFGNRAGQPEIPLTWLCV